MNSSWEAVMANEILIKYSAVVEASWFLVGISMAYLEKWSVITRMFSNPPFDLYKHRKSMHKSSCGLDVCIVTSSVLGFSIVLITLYAPFTMLYFFLDISIHVGPIKPSAEISSPPTLSAKSNPKVFHVCLPGISLC